MRPAGRRAVFKQPAARGRNDRTGGGNVGSRGYAKIVGCMGPIDFARVDR